MSDAPGRDRPLRVLLIATYSQALSAFVAPLARFLEARGHEVTMAASDEALVGPATFPQLRADGFRAHVIPFTNRMRPDRDLAAAWAAYRLIRRGRFDVVHTFTAKAGFLGRFAARAAGAPLVLHTAFSFPHLDTPEKAWLYGPLERLATRMSDHVFCISEVGHRQARSLGVSPRRGFSNPGIGLNLDRFRERRGREASRLSLALPPDAPLVGTAARLVPHKRIDLFIAICRRVADRRPGVRFLVLGDGPERAALEALRHRLGLDDRLRFLERLSSEQVVAYFRSLDVFVLPTRREGFGMVFAEAMAMETPVVAPRQPPMDEIVTDGDTGFLVDPDDADGYAAAVLRLLDDAATRTAFGARARERVFAHFDQARSLAAIEAAYRDLLRGAGGPPR